MRPVEQGEICTLKKGNRIRFSEIFMKKVVAKAATTAAAVVAHIRHPSNIHVLIEEPLKHSINTDERHTQRTVHWHGTYTPSISCVSIVMSERILLIAKRFKCACFFLYSAFYSFVTIIISAHLVYWNVLCTVFFPILLLRHCMQLTKPSYKSFFQRRLALTAKYVEYKQYRAQKSKKKATEYEICWQKTNFGLKKKQRNGNFIFKYAWKRSRIVF